MFAIGAMAHPRRLNIPGEDLPKVHHLFVEPYAYIRKDALVVGGGNSAAEAALFLSEEGARTTLAIWREDWENRDPKAGAMKHWVRSAARPGSCGGPFARRAVQRGPLNYRARA